MLYIAFYSEYAQAIDTDFLTRCAMLKASALGLSWMESAFSILSLPPFHYKTGIREICNVFYENLRNMVIYANNFK